MHKIYYVPIFTACLWISRVDCQVGRGGGSGIGGGEGGSRGRLQSSCTTDECRRSEIFLVLIPIFSVAVFLLIYLLRYCFRGKPSMDNITFVHSHPDGEDPKESRKHEFPLQNLMDSTDRKVFRNSIWTSRYYQYGEWNGPIEFGMSLNTHTRRLRGWGSDYVGKFTITGHYSIETCRMAFTKTYIKDTGGEKENFGDVVIQLTKNTRTTKFEGKWYMQTIDYVGEDKFELEFVRECEYDEVYEV